jgi:prephenate dehydratase
VDIEGSVNDVNVSKALIDLVRKASFVKVFGSFPKARLPE